MAFLSEFLLYGFKFIVLGAFIVAGVVVGIVIKKKKLSKEANENIEKVKIN